MLNENNSRPSATESGVEYKVGPGRPPKEHQFKPGQSGNPKGATRKPKAMAPDLKAALEQALSKTIKLKQGERERIVSMAVAGIEQLVVQFAKGNPHAWRHLFAVADKLGIGAHRSGHATGAPGRSGGLSAGARRLRGAEPAGDRAARRNL